MGCCVSKCRPEYKPSPEEEQHNQHHFNFNHVQLKLPISSQTPPPLPPTLYSSTKISPSPPSPTSSTSSISSFTCTTSNTISSASSLSTASSSLSSKDRSFSNEFLWSCYKDNPHIITRINSLRDATSLSFLPPTKPNGKLVNINPSPPKPNLSPLNKHSPAPQSFSMPQKRVRSNSPTNLTRQKSFRKDTERSITINHASNVQSRSLLRSPSPSRRFNGDKCERANLATTMNISKVSSVISGVHSNSHHSVLSSTRKESVKAASPNHNCSRRVLHSCLRNTHETSCTLGLGFSPKVDETVVKDVVSDHDMDLSLMEDIDNPLISLDCFIFL